MTSNHPVVIAVANWLLCSATTLLAQPPIDFSYAGYSGGGVSAPVVPARVSVRPSGGDDTNLIQGAIDRISKLPLTANGFRGAVLLRPGRYLVSGQIHIRAGGVVLRGAGSAIGLSSAIGAGSAIIVATGLGRRALIAVGNPSDPVLGPPFAVTEETVPAGSRTLTLANPGSLRAGDRVVITRPSTKEWMSELKMTGLPGLYAGHADRLDAGRPSIAITRDLGRAAYHGLWFDPRTGNTRPLEAPFAGKAGDVLQKPTPEAWLILLQS